MDGLHLLATGPGPGDDEDDDDDDGNGKGSDGNIDPDDDEGYDEDEDDEDDEEPLQCSARPVACAATGCRPAAATGAAARRRWQRRATHREP